MIKMKKLSIQSLKAVFSSYGEIEYIHLDPLRSLYAFIKFKRKSSSKSVILDTLRADNTTQIPSKDYLILPKYFMF